MPNGPGRRIQLATIHPLLPPRPRDGSGDRRRRVKRAQATASKKTGGRTGRKLAAFDAARYLTSDRAIAEYLTAVLETDDTDLLLAALGDIARARGMAHVAERSGLGRESLYKALLPGAKPRFDTILRVARALGVKLSARVA